MSGLRSVCQDYIVVAIYEVDPKVNALHYRPIALLALLQRFLRLLALGFRCFQISNSLAHLYQLSYELLFGLTFIFHLAHLLTLAAIAPALSDCDGLV